MSVATASVTDAAERLAAHREGYGHVYDVLDVAAAARDARPGPLSGVPFAVKDLFDLAGRVTRSGSALTADDAPAARSAAVVRALEAAGAVAVGVTAMDEFAHGFTTINDHFGTCRNPHDPARIAGGSSGGSAAAVALGDVPVALGSDTNGSGRVPASLCGVVGLKPGYGVVSTEGMAPFAPGLDHVSWFTDTVERAEAVLDAVAPDTAAATHSPRVAAAGPQGWAGAEALAAVDAALGALGLLGSATVELPPLDRTLDASLLITAAEGAEVHHDRLRRDRARFGASARIGLTAGALLPAGALVTAERYRAVLRESYAALFESVDVLVLPTTPVVAPLIGEREVRLGDQGVRGREPSLGVFTAPFSLLGLPAVSVPIRRRRSSGAAHDGLPLGVQLAGASGSERTLLAVARMLVERCGADELGAEVA
ncbi:amidase family protein [Herbiconiux moechotypicola]|uniref:AtzE family amidohydrolase n=1 Tax=Herbiconiux moechotypicola TaxID=637393 RepID=A0ABP5Q3T7_9MICO|nr:amidase family protein [Herbiconiux moechotypicola]MCS5729019.1 amidase family protein [Herbiconiux moechotypicola]